MRICSYQLLGKRYFRSKTCEYLLRHSFTGNPGRVSYIEPLPLHCVIRRMNMYDLNSSYFLLWKWRKSSPHISSELIAQRFLQYSVQATADIVTRTVPRAPTGKRPVGVWKSTKIGAIQTRVNYYLNIPLTPPLVATAKGGLLGLKMRQDSVGREAVIEAECNTSFLFDCQFISLQIF